MEIIKRNVMTDDTVGIMQQQINDLACCGNCKYGDVGLIRCVPFVSYNCCDQWEYDGLSAEDRKI